MNNLALRVYQHLPEPLRSIAASCYGLRLRSWRYGPETDELVEQALSREQWSADKWNEWQKDRLAFVFHRAATKVPYYRNHWELRRRKGDRSSWEYLDNWPVLDKQSLRENPKAFVADDCDIAKMYREHTSGTTGTPLTLWYSRKTLRAWNGLFEARARGWHGVTRHENWATLGGKQVVPAGIQRPPFWVWNQPMRQLYLSATHVSRQNVKAFMDALRCYRVTHMVVYPSSASILAAEALDLGLETPKLSVIITVAEPLTPQRRHLLSAAFQCEVRETYGMAEIVAEATECEHGALHCWPEVGQVEVFGDHEDTPVRGGTAGRLICTSLVNEDMPLIRYAVGDRGRLITRERICECGRHLPLLSRIEGRTNDLLRALDGRQIYVPLTFVLDGIAVREVQVVQESIDRLTFRYVSLGRLSDGAVQLIIHRLKERMGNDIHVSVESVAEIPRETNGKFRAVICKIEGLRPVLPQKENGCERATTA